LCSGLRFEGVGEPSETEAEAELFIGKCGEFIGKESIGEESSGQNTRDVDTGIFGGSDEVFVEVFW